MKIVEGEGDRAETSNIEQPLKGYKKSISTDFYKFAGKLKEHEHSSTENSICLHKTFKQSFTVHRYS